MSAPVEKLNLPQEVWSGDDCSACLISCKTETEKQFHEKSDLHFKNLKRYQFLKNECIHLPASRNPSKLVRRFKYNCVKAIGLECFLEFNFYFTTVSWWACTVCNEAGTQYSEADTHLFSIEHLERYTKLFYTSKTSILQSTQNKSKYFDVLMDIVDEIYKLQGYKNKDPSVFDLPLSEAEAWEKLSVIKRCDPYTLRVHNRYNKTKRYLILQCSICFELIPCSEANCNRAWKTHEESVFHRNSKLIQHVLHQIGCCDVPRKDVPRTSISFEKRGDIFYGPEVGLEYLVTGGEENYCLLCFCFLNSVKDHFSSEEHIARFLSTKECLKIFNMRMINGNGRREGFKNVLDSTLWNNQKNRKIVPGVFPKIIKFLSSKGECFTLKDMPKFKSYSLDFNCLFCEVCNRILKIKKDGNSMGSNNWDAHVQSQEHFDALAKKSLYYFDKAYMVPLISTLDFCPHEYVGKWVDKKVNNIIQRVLPLGEIGLDVMVDDVDKNEVVCTLCAEIFPRVDHDNIKNHVRSYNHITKYIISSNPTFHFLLNTQTRNNYKEAFVLDYIKRNSYLNISLVMHSPVQNKSEMKVYSPRVAGLLSSKSVIPKTFPLDRGRTENLDLKNAVFASCCRITGFTNHGDSNKANTSNVVIRCMECNLTFSDTIGNMVQSIWENHMVGHDHLKRVRKSRQVKLKLSGFVDERPKYKPTIKHTMDQFWAFNNIKNTYEFVAANVGLSYIVERRSLLDSDDASQDFYCQLCCLTFPLNLTALEEHIRSFSHILMYFRYRHPESLHKLDPSLDEKILRSNISTVYLDKKAQIENQMLVFDPASERKENDLTVKLLQDLENGSKAAHEYYLIKKGEQEKKDKASNKETSDTYISDHNEQHVLPPLIQRNSSQASTAISYRASMTDRKVPDVLFDLNKYKTTSDAVEQLLLFDAEKIPDNEIPVIFNQNIGKKEGVVGLQYVHEVACADGRSYDTFLCSLCKLWETPSRMIDHLCKESHKLAFFKVHHVPVYLHILSESDEIVQNTMINEFSIQLSKESNHLSQIKSRLFNYTWKGLIDKFFPNIDTDTLSGELSISDMDVSCDGEIIDDDPAIDNITLTVPSDKDYHGSKRADLIRHRPPIPSKGNRKQRTRSKSAERRLDALKRTGTLSSLFMRDQSRGRSRCRSRSSSSRSRSRSRSRCRSVRSRHHSRTRSPSRVRDRNDNHRSSNESRRRSRSRSRSRRQSLRRRSASRRGRKRSRTKSSGRKRKKSSSCKRSPSRVRRRSVSKTKSRSRSRSRLRSRSRSATRCVRSRSRRSPEPQKTLRSSDSLKSRKDGHTVSSSSSATIITISSDDEANDNSVKSSSEQAKAVSTGSASSSAVTDKGLPSIKSLLSLPPPPLIPPPIPPFFPPLGSPFPLPPPIPFPLCPPELFYSNPSNFHVPVPRPIINVAKKKSG